MRRTTWIALGVLLALASLMGLAGRKASLAARKLDTSYFGLSAARTADGRAIEPESLGGSDYCGNCHTQIFHEWNSSLHHFSSFNNVVYRRVALDVMQKRGPGSLAFCAGCHDPVALLGGELPVKRLNDWSINAGITCLACHRITRIHGGNGGYTLAAPTLNATLLTDRPWLQPLHQMGLKLAPALHRRALSKPFYKSSGYCATCHSLTSPRALNGHEDLVLQDESRDAPPGTSCIDCHMPRVRSSDPAAQGGLARSHRFTGGNTAVPLWNRDDEQRSATDEFLRSGKITSRCTTLRPLAGREKELRCEVRNAGVGHAFPAGTTDSNQAWVEIRVVDRAGAVLFQHNAAAVFRTDFVDRRRRSTDRRNTATEAIAVRSSTLLEPGETRPLRVRFHVSPQTAYPLSATVEVKWRKYPDSLMSWLHPDRAAPAVPVTVLAASLTTFDAHDARSP